MTVQISNMQCNSCVLLVIALLLKLEFGFSNVEVGSITFSNDLSSIKLIILKDNLKLIGFDIIDSKSALFAESVKIEIIEIVHQLDGTQEKNVSEQLVIKFNHTYKYISDKFTKEFGVTLKKYTNILKLEKIKELLLNHDITFSEIASIMQFNSVQYLCNFFMKHEGVNSTKYLQMKLQKLNLYIG